jgi:restriction system protein
MPAKEGSVNENQVFWGFHILAGGDSLVKKGYVAVGWPEMGDLAKIGPTRDSFKARVREVYGEKLHIANSTGQLFRFVHEMKPNDVIIYRSKIDRNIHIGRVKGPYRFLPALDAEYCNVREVEWIKTVAATLFSQGALYELGSALTLFQVRNYAAEFQAALSEEKALPAVEEDESVGIVADQVQLTTEDFILKELDRQLKGHPFQGFVATLLNAIGYRTEVFAKGTDDGIDILAHKDELRLEPPIIKIQAKSGSGGIGGPDVKALFGNLGTGEFGLFITLGTFSPQARSFAKTKPNLRLIDGSEFVTLVLGHYEELDPRYKAMIPLKRVYIPQPPEEAGNK